MKSLEKKDEGKKGEEGEAGNANTGFFTPNNKIDFSNVKIEPLFEETVDFETFSKSDFRAVKVKDCVPVPKSKKLLQFTLDDGTGHDLDENISNKSKELCIICGKQIMKWSLCFIIGFAIDLLWVGAGLILAAILNTVLLFRLMVLRDHFENGK